MPIKRLNIPIRLNDLFKVIRFFNSREEELHVSYRDLKDQLQTDLNVTAGSSTLDGLSDVVITSVANGQVLVYDSATSQWINQTAGPATTLDGLSDVVISSLGGGQFLVYNSTTSQWENTSVTIPTTLNSLSDVTTPSPSDGDVLTWDSATSEWVSLAPVYSSTFAGLSDVNVAGVAADDTIRYDFPSGKWVPTNITPATSLNGLTDVTLGTLSNGQFLVYNSTSSQWENQSISPSGVTSVGTGTGLTGGTITGAGTIQLNTKLAPADAIVGNAGKFLRVNAGETALEYATVTGTGTVTSVAVSAGTGITASVTGNASINPTINITNSAPDQTVALSNGTGINVTGTYPNFTIANTAPDQTVALSSGAGISVTGTYPNFTIANTGGGVSSVTATPPITSSGGSTPIISTSMATNKLIGRGTAATGPMEEITLGTNLSLSGTTLNATGGGIPKGTASGTDTYTVNIAGVTAYNDGDAYLIRFTNGNTTGSTLEINPALSLGAKDLYRNNDGPLIGGDIWAGSEMLCVYNSSLNAGVGGFQCIGTSPNSLFTYVTNDDTVTITKGMPVVVSGGIGDRIKVVRAYNTSDQFSAQTVGLAVANITAGQKGIIIMQGLLSNLSILPPPPGGPWQDGDPVYLGDTPGSITRTKPHAPNHLVYLGFVTSTSPGNSGRLYVRVQNGYELDELHNVQAQSPTVNDILYYFGGTPGQWKTASIATILGYTPLTQTLPNTQIFVGNASNAATAVAMSGDTTISNTGAVTIANNAVTYAKMQAVSATSILLGSSSTNTPVQEITLGTGLSMSGNTLSASGSAGDSIASLSNSSGDVSAAASNPSELNVVATLRANLKTGSCGVTFDGGGQVVQTKIAYVQMPYNGTLGAWFMVADQLGACTITVSKGTFIAFPTSSPVYVTPPAIPATNQKALVALPTYNSGMATVTAGDVLKFEISSVTAITWVNLSISIAKT
jgi:hypothetical protein